MRSRRDLGGGQVLQASAVGVPVVVGEDRVDLVRAANQLDHPIGGIVGDGLGIGVRAVHADGEHVVVVLEVHDFAIGIGHRDRQVGVIIRERRNKLPAARDLLVLADHAPARVVHPLGVVRAKQEISTTCAEKFVDKAT